MPSVLDQLRSLSSTILHAPRRYFRAIHRDREEPDSRDPAVFSLAEIKQMGNVNENILNVLLKNKLIYLFRIKNGRILKSVKIGTNSRSNIAVKNEKY